GPKRWDLDWHEYVWGDELERLSLEQLRSAEMLLFGRVTYEGMVGYWASAHGAVADLMNAIPKIVFSRTLGKADWARTRLLRGSAEQEVARLKQLRQRSVHFRQRQSLRDTHAARVDR